MNYASQLEEGIVAWLLQSLDCRVVGYSQDKDPARSLPAVSVVCAPAQDWQGLCQVETRVNVLTNAIVDTTRERAAAIMALVREALANENSDDINQLAGAGIQFAGFGEWTETEADILATETESTNTMSATMLGFCVVDPDIV